MPGAVATFEALAVRGKRLIVLSNTSRRRSHALKKLPGLGFNPEFLTGFVCSGEQAWEHMKMSSTGERVLYISWADDFLAWDPAYLDGLNVTLAPAAEADFILCHGSMMVRDGTAAQPTDMLESGVPSEALLEALRTCADRGLPMVCANPDFHVTLPWGARGYMPGCIAQMCALATEF